MLPSQPLAARESFCERAALILQDMFEARAALRGQRPVSTDTRLFAVPHALTLSFFPKWLTKVARAYFDGAPLDTKFVALNAHDAMIALGTEGFRPSACAQRDGKPGHQLPGKASAPVPHLAYSPNALLGR